MNKFGYILVILIAILVIAGSFIGFSILFTSSATPAPGTTVPDNSYNPSTQPNTTTVTPNQTVTNNTTPAENTYALKTGFGGNLMVKNFFSSPDVVKDPVNPGYYYFGYHVYEGVPDPTASTTTPPYVIQYIDKTQYFNISILRAPIGANRSAMEQYLMDHLGVTKNKLCRLKYAVSVASDIAPDDINANIGFSSCPGATQFDQ